MIKAILYLLGSFILGMAAFCFLSFVVFSVADEVISDWYFIWPMILIVLVSFILSVIIDTITHNRKYGYDLNESRWYLLDGKKTLTEEEDKQREKESATRLGLIWAGTSIPAILIYFVCMMIFY